MNAAELLIYLKWGSIDEPVPAWKKKQKRHEACFDTSLTAGLGETQDYASTALFILMRTSFRQPFGLLNWKFIITFEDKEDIKEKQRRT